VSKVKRQQTREGKTQLDLESQINPEAYDDYLQARFFLHQETVQKDKAIPHLERAIQLDPDFTAAYAAMGQGGAWRASLVSGTRGRIIESRSQPL
jgi:hypothetical protein